LSRASSEASFRAFAGIARWLGTAALKVIVSETLPLARAPQALAASRTGHVRGKIVLTTSLLE
jgi:NADPH:quinone reductase-like Zn-dependent oxidoreductase